MPKKLFISKQRIENFTFRKVNPKFIYNSYTLRSPKDLKRWSSMVQSTLVTFEPPSMHPGKLVALKINEPKILAAKTDAELGDVVFSMNINLISSERKLGNKVSYLHAVEEGGQYVFKNAWLLNNWILDHPYGPKILNLPWQTKIFITEGRQSMEIIGIPEVKQGGFGRLRGIQSYRLVMMKNTLKTNGDKL